MKTEFKAKFLNHLIQRKKGDKGFTLIELLVVIIIIGILAAIALPAFLNQANKAKQSEAKQYVGALMRSQQAYYLERSSFTSDVNNLAKPVSTDTENYTYEMPVTGEKTTAETVNVLGNQDDKPALRSYVGGVTLAQVEVTSEATTAALLCETKRPGVDATALSNAQIAPAGNAAQSCGADQDPVK